MKNTWLVKIIEEMEKNKHGKIIINFNNGDAPSVEVVQRINKDLTTEKDCSLKICK